MSRSRIAAMIAAYAMIAFGVAACENGANQGYGSPGHPLTACDTGFGCHSYGEDGTDLNPYDNSSP